MYVVVSSIHRCRVTNDQAINVWQSLAVHAFMPSLVRTAVVILHNTRAISILKTLLPDFKGLMSDGSVSFVHLEAGAKGCITPDHRNRKRNGPRWQQSGHQKCFGSRVVNQCHAENPESQSVPSTMLHIVHWRVHYVRAVQALNISAVAWWTTRTNLKHKARTNESNVSMKKTSVTEMPYYPQYLP